MYVHTYIYMYKYMHVHISILFLNEVLAAPLTPIDSDLARFSDPINIAQTLAR